MVERLRPRKWHDRVAKPIAQEKERQRIVTIEVTKPSTKHLSDGSGDFGPPQKAFSLNGSGKPFVYYRTKASSLCDEQRRYYVGRFQICFARVFKDRIELFLDSKAAIVKDLSELHEQLKEMLTA